jgi:NADH-quinone oxidoreductase subunit N
MRGGRNRSAFLRYEGVTMQSAPMYVLFPDAVVVFSIVIASRLGDICSEATTRQLTYLMALVSSTVAGVLFVIQSFDPQQYHFFSRMILVDSFASVMKAAVSFAFAVSLVYSRRYLDERGMFQDYVFLLGMFSLLGQLIMISGNHFLTLYPPCLQ